MMSPRTVSGSAIALAVLGIAAVATFLLGIVQLFPQQVRDSQRTTAQEQAEYAAWAGAEHGLLELKRARSSGTRFELSAQQQKDPTREFPYAKLTEKQASCLASGCLSYRQLFSSKENATPVSFSLGKEKGGPYYELLVWHRFESQAALGLVPITDLLQGKTALSLFTPSFPPAGQSDGDVGVDVIESTGVSDGARYVLRLIVDPAKGTIREVLPPPR